ncbi:hypothetical protein MSAN_00509600 [Mycena sanguinolenta]|uniref:Xylanolytic transcriptional activator regulatory domain-containing protein n=1 Tax=Mycena sanguinolenta TaxID=230812 RepID=A0A8H6Z8S5_9AGAR|nr:hypothetical protein MSAN_00509600 [Mycena sanguinolenta]
MFVLFLMLTYCLLLRMRQYLTEQIRQKDRVIESLLQQLQNPYVSTLPSMFASPVEAASQRGDVWFEKSPPNGQRGNRGEGDMGQHINADVLPIVHAPLGFIAHLSHRGHSEPRSGKPDDVDESDIGVANMAYFEPGPAIDLRMRARLLEHSVPEIVIHGIVVPEDVDKLFEICPVLFTVVCAVSSRYYTEKSEIYPIAMQFAKRSAANALNEGWKTIELCQAYLLLSIYAVPVQNWEQDCTWLFTGVAIRLATDLNLHQEPIGTATQADEQWERERLNRTLRQTAGDKARLPHTSVMRCRSNDWYSRSPYNSVYDLHLCVTTGLLLIVADFQDQIFSSVSPSSLNQARLLTDVDFRTVTIAHAAKLGAFSDEWAYRFAQQSNSNDPTSIWQFKLFTFFTAYSRLVLFSFALEQAYRAGLQSTDDLLCLESAKTLLCTVIEGLSPTGFMCYCPDGHFIIVTFALAVLLKLLGPKFSPFVLESEEMQVYDLITQVIQTLSSSAVNDRHIPKLYAQLLDGRWSLQQRDRNQQCIPRSIGGPSSGNYAAATSSTFTMSSFLGGGTGADSEQEIHQYQDVYRRTQTTLLAIHRPIAMHPIQHNPGMQLWTEQYNEPA